MQNTSRAASKTWKIEKLITSIVLNKDPRPGNQDPGLRTPGHRTQDPTLRTLRLRNFLLNFKLRRWKVRNRLKVNVITQSTLSHILTFTYFSRVKIYFWHFQKDSVDFCLRDLSWWFDFTLPETAWERSEGGTFSLNLSN